MKNKKLVKGLLILGLVLFIVGGIIFTISMSISKWDFGVLSNHVVKKEVVEITEEVATVKVIDVKLSTADVKYLYHDENKIIVEGYDLVSRKGKVLEKFSTKIENGTLYICLERKASAWFQMGTQGKEELVIKMPKETSVGLTVELSTGDVFIGEAGKTYTFDNLDIKTSTGDLNLLGIINCQSLSVKTDTGDTYVKGNLTANEFVRNANTGDLIINASIIANKISVTHSTGDVDCKTYITASLIDVKTSTGSVTLRLLGSKQDYSYTYDISTGESNISAFTGGAKQVKVKVSTGDVNIYFES